MNPLLGPTLAVYCRLRVFRTVVPMDFCRSPVSRLRAALADLGCDKAVIADETLISRLDEWLLQNVLGQRRAPSYEAALMHAAKMGWLDVGARRRKR
jgi:hypothetical protein